MQAKQVKTRNFLYQQNVNNTERYKIELYTSSA